MYVCMYDTNVKAAVIPNVLYGFPDDGQAQAAIFGNNIENV